MPCGARPCGPRWQDCSSVDESMSGTGTARLFFAVVPDAATRELVGSAAQALRCGPESRLVPRTNYHLTVAFVGEVSVSAVALLRSIGAAQSASAFSLRFDAYDFWPKPEVIVARARSVPVPLERLWQKLHSDLAPHRFALEPKRLRPHVTLLRKVARAPDLPPMNGFDWKVSDFSLMRSDIDGAHPAYTVVDTWPLLYEPEKS
jgi:RNA 2',3'-cyclic 3'-phosphodiesterase